MDPTLDELASRQQWSPQDTASMTHFPSSPNPAEPYLEKFKQLIGGLPGGLTGMFPGLHQYMPAPIEAAGQVFQSQPAHDALSVTGGLPLIEAAWTPAEISLLKRMYSSKNYDPSMFPGRSPDVIRRKAFLLGLKRPEIPPYERKPGSPSIVNNEEMVGQIMQLLSKGNMTLGQISEKVGVSERTLRRYLSENLQIRQKGKDIWNDPKRIQQYKDMVAKGWSQRQMAKALEMDVSGVSQQLALLNRAGHIDYIPGGGTRTISMPSFSTGQGEVGDPEFEKALEEFFRQNFPSLGDLAKQRQ